MRDEVLLVRLQSLPVLNILHNKIQLKTGFSDPYSSDTNTDPEHPALLFLLVIFALLDPHPDPESGSTDLIESVSNPIPKP